jgi:hypothetical protein
VVTTRQWRWIKKLGYWGIRRRERIEGFRRRFTIGSGEDLPRCYPQVLLKNCERFLPKLVSSSRVPLQWTKSNPPAIYCFGFDTRCSLICSLISVFGFAWFWTIFI